MEDAHTVKQVKQELLEEIKRSIMKYEKEPMIIVKRFLLGKIIEKAQFLKQLE